MSLSVLIPVKEPEPWLPKVLLRLDVISKKYPGLIEEVLEERAGSLSEARRQLLERSKASFILNLDADTLIPHDYPAAALDVLRKNPRVGAVAINYRPKPIRHLGFGTSIMTRFIMKQFYTWRNSEEDLTCECEHFWRQLTGAGYVLATLPFVAYHKSKKRLPAIPTERPKR